MKHTFFLFKNS